MDLVFFQIFPCLPNQVSFPRRELKTGHPLENTPVLALFQGFPENLPVATGVNFYFISKKKERINKCKKSLIFRILSMYVENNGTFDVVGKSCPAVEIGLFAPVAMGRYLILSRVSFRYLTYISLCYLTLPYVTSRYLTLPCYLALPCVTSFLLPAVFPYGVRGRPASGQQLAALHLHPRGPAGVAKHAHAKGAETCGIPQLR